GAHDPRHRAVRSVRRPHLPPAGACAGRRRRARRGDRGARGAGRRDACGARALAAGDRLRREHRPQGRRGRGARAGGPGRRGSLAIVGIGPGNAAWRTPEVTQALADAEEVVGYTAYLDLVADAIAGKPRHDGTLGAEEARAALALDLAAAGKRVALVSSGDA